MSKPCPVPGCTDSARSGHLMCRDHWYRVPRDLRAEVRDSWRSYLAGPRNPGAAGREAKAIRYATAARTAIAKAQRS